MSFILNIDTAVGIASVCLAKDGEALQTLINETRNDHAGWLHPSIDTIVNNAGITVKDIDAIAVTIGPGSYTGLRVGLATAKGLCFAMNIPLIVISTLDMMAFAVKNEAIDLICPMIDARRMEIFTAVYNKNLDQIESSSSMIVDEKSFSQLLNSHKILFCGNGSFKLQGIISNKNAMFSNIIGNATSLAPLSYKKFCKKEFADLAYVEPHYIKEFYSVSRKT
ncbi:MAG: tRNA (adenosine(37)-N6)-threonylcarbamoyltransferase complex dimerization subunit type 1 TsaB [Bacteroidia bacterium]|nr:tRNA (adenosine(37)-N6)-threonylcarbamoyltransferase complex dimerization subunit type 1 TsaB [Bacteroidia bacterium]